MDVITFLSLLEIALPAIFHILSDTFGGCLSTIEPIILCGNMFKTPTSTFDGFSEYCYRAGDS